VPTPDTPSSTPMTFGRSCSVVALVTSAKPAGMISAAPTPCTARAAMSTGTDVATPHTSELSPNTAIPVSSTSRRPSISPSRPAGISTAPRAIM
jgi:hypothetical protein